MALLPCQFSDHRFRGPSSMIYPALVDNHDSLRWKVRLCPEHAAFVEKTLVPYEVKESDEAIRINKQCVSCLKTMEPKLEPIQNFYVTAYFKGQERRDFWGAVHLDCGKPPWLPYTSDTLSP